MIGEGQLLRDDLDEREQIVLVLFCLGYLWAAITGR
jgi:hypothetical protein